MTQHIDPQKIRDIFGMEWRYAIANCTVLGSTLINLANYLRRQENGGHLANQLDCFVAHHVQPGQKPFTGSSENPVTNTTQLVEALRGAVAYFLLQDQPEPAQQFAGFFVAVCRALFGANDMYTADADQFLSQTMQILGNGPAAAQFYLPWLKFLASKLNQAESADYPFVIRPCDIANALWEYSRLAKQAGMSDEAVEHFTDMGQELVNDEPERQKQILDEIAHLPDPTDTPDLPDNSK